MNEYLPQNGQLTITDSEPDKEPHQESPATAEGSAMPTGDAPSEHADSAVDLQKVQQALSKSKKRLQLAIEGAELGMWDLDVPNGDVQISELWLRRMGYGLQHRREKIEFWRRLVHAEDVDAVEKAVVDHINGVTCRCEMEFRLRHADGQWRWILGRGKISEQQEDGSAVKLTGTFIDNTVHKNTIIELERKSQALTRSNEELEHFAYIASHDLQEPLRKVASFTEMFGRKYRGQLDDKADQYLYYIVDGARRMQLLINDLLEYSRVDTRETDFQPVDCGEITAHVLSVLSNLITDSNATVNVSEMPVVQGNASQLTQIFQNLICNAIKFRGQDPPVVEISAQLIDGHYKISVTDNGIGFDEKYREHIFVIFKRLHQKDQYAGSGIGLSICKKIVERHGGTIAAESDGKNGARFWFTIPAKRCARKNTRL